MVSCSANLAVGCRESDELGAAGEERRRSGLVGDDVRPFVAINRAEGGDDLRQRQRVGRRATDHRKYGDLLFEYLARDGLQFGGQFVAAIGRDESLVGFAQGGQNGIACGSDMVATEIPTHVDSLSGVIKVCPADCTRGATPTSSTPASSRKRHRRQSFARNSWLCPSRCQIAASRRTVRSQMRCSNG